MGKYSISPFDKKCTLCSEGLKCSKEKGVEVRNKKIFIIFRGRFLVDIGEKIPLN